MNELTKIVKTENTTTEYYDDGVIIKCDKDCKRLYYKDCRCIERWYHQTDDYKVSRIQWPNGISAYYDENGKIVGRYRPHNLPKDY